jgi:hypothetical protein
LDAPVAPSSAGAAVAATATEAGGWRFTGAGCAGASAGGGGAEGAQAAARGKRPTPSPSSSVAAYLALLRAAAVALRPLGPRAVVLLAAAVSDFDLPRSRLAEHKLQSRDLPPPPPPPRATPSSAPMLPSSPLSSSPPPPPASGAGVMSRAAQTQGLAGSFLCTCPPCPRRWRCCASLVPRRAARQLQAGNGAGAAAAQGGPGAGAYSVDAVVANLLERRYAEVTLVQQKEQQQQQQQQQRQQRNAGLDVEERLQRETVRKTSRRRRSRDNAFRTDAGANDNTRAGSAPSRRMPV